MKTELIKLTPKAFCKATGACSEGAKFAMKYRSMRSVWEHCQRPDWLIWVLNAIDAPCDERVNRLWMAWCARNTPLPDGRTVSALLTQPCLDAVSVAERFANGRASGQELSAAWSAALSAAWSAAWSAAESAAESAAWSAALSAAESAAWSAALSAALSAAESAARSAAESAAESAALSAQAEELKKLIANPFA